LNPRENKTLKRSTTSKWRPLLRAFYTFLTVIALLWATPRNADAQLYVTQNPGSGLGFVSEYKATTGEVIKADFITGLNFPLGLGVVGPKTDE